MAERQKIARTRATSSVAFPYPVERVFMVERHVDPLGQVFVRDRQKLEVAPRHLHVDETSIRRARVELLEAHPDGDLPRTRRANELAVALNRGSAHQS